MKQNVFYICLFKYEEKLYVKFGISEGSINLKGDIRDRINSHKNQITKDLYLVHVIKIENCKDLENRFKQNIATIEKSFINNEIKTEIIELNDTITIESTIKLADFANKQNAKRTLVNNFTKDEDYKILLIPKDEQKNADEEVLIPKDENLNANKTILIPKDRNKITVETRGRPKEQIMMNIDTFKSLCMLVKTDKGKEIRKYYVTFRLNIFLNLFHINITNKFIKMNNVAIINQENKNQRLNELSIKKFQDLNIPIYGTYEEPLFKAKDIGDLLGIEKIRDNVAKLDEQCKVMKAAGSAGGLQEQWFLTEDGLYELLFISRKPLAKQFKIWLRNVIKEVRLTGKYETQKYIESHTKSDLLIEQNKDKSINYLGIVEKTPDYTIAKYGHTKYAKDTLNRHKETYGDNFHFVHILECERNHDLEKKIQTHTDLVSRHIKEYQGTKRMELLRLDNNFTINNLIELMKSLKDSMETKYSIQLELSKELTKQKEIDTKQKELETKQKELEYAFELKKLEMNHILEIKKLELGIHQPILIQQVQEQPLEENLSEELQFHKWLNENVSYTIGNILIWKEVTFKLMNKRVGSGVSSKYKGYFENWCEIKFPNVNDVTYKVHRTDNGSVRGYTNFKLKDN